ncbi:hypothetical protein GCM10009678_54660 [Actinomadura kijaniata]
MGDRDRRFREANDYAARNGYVAGLPTFHQADHGSGVVYGTFLVKPRKAEFRDARPAVRPRPPPRRVRRHRRAQP